MAAVATQPTTTATSTSHRPGRARSGRRRPFGRLAVAVAAAAVVLTGCGSGSAEPEPKNWDEDASKSQQQDQGDGSSGEGDDADDDAESRDENEVIREGDGGDDPDEDTAAAAEAFVADYLDAQNAATKNGDFSQVDPMIEECEICSTSRATIEDVYGRGGKVEGSLFTDIETTAGSEDDGKITVTVVSTISEYEVTDASGSVVDSGPAEKQTYQYSVSEQGGEWKIVSGRFVK